MQLRHSDYSEGQLDAIYAWDHAAGLAVDDALDRIEERITNGAANYPTYDTPSGLASYLRVPARGKVFIIVWLAASPQYIYRIDEL